MPFNLYIHYLGILRAPFIINGYVVWLTNVLANVRYQRICTIKTRRVYYMVSQFCNGVTTCLWHEHDQILGKFAPNFALRLLIDRRQIYRGDECCDLFCVRSEANMVCDRKS